MKKTPMSSLELKKLIQKIFKETVENIQATELLYTQYFSKEYTQCVDGVSLNYEAFVAHMKMQKEALKSLKIVFHEMIAEGGKVATFNTVYATRKDAKKVEVQVIALFELRDGKVISCNELTRLVKGEESDRDIGSRH